MPPARYIPIWIFFADVEDNAVADDADAHARCLLESLDVDKVPNQRMDLTYPGRFVSNDVLAGRKVA